MIFIEAEWRGAPLLPRAGEGVRRSLTDEGVLRRASGNVERVECSLVILAKARIHDRPQAPAFACRGCRLSPA